MQHHVEIYDNESCNGIISSDVAGTKSFMSFCYSAIPPPSIDPSTCQNPGPAVDTATADDQVEEKC
jgi:hypothetical protein